MSTGQTYSSDVAFTPSVKADADPQRFVVAISVWKSEALGRLPPFTPELAEFIEAQASIFLATVNIPKGSPSPASRRPGRLPAGT